MPRRTPLLDMEFLLEERKGFSGEGLIEELLGYRACPLSAMRALSDIDGDSRNYLFDPSEYGTVVGLERIGER
jgi:hypothetical protein